MNDAIEDYYYSWAVVVGWGAIITHKQRNILQSYAIILLEVQHIIVRDIYITIYYDDSVK